MRRIAIILFLACLVSAAGLTTAGLINAQPIFYVLGLWLFVLSLAIFFSLLLRMYQRIMARIHDIKQLLSEMRFLQERRYEQLARRLDTLRGGGSDASLGSATAGATHAEFENLSARLQRSERRILGKLEDEMLRYDERVRELAQTLATLKEDPRDTPE